MFEVYTHYLGDDHDPEVHFYQFDEYNDAMLKYAYEIVFNDSFTIANDITARGYDFIEVSLWKMDGKLERLAHWMKPLY